jgi:hypothetical protein
MYTISISLALLSSLPHIILCDPLALSIICNVPFKSNQSLISWLVAVQSRQQVAILNPLIKLYRLVVAVRPNIDIFPIVSTKSTPRNRAARSESTSNFRNLRKSSKIAIDTNNNNCKSNSTTVKINVSNHSSASLRSPSPNRLSYDQVINDGLIVVMSQKAPA